MWELRLSDGHVFVRTKVGTAAGRLACGLAQRHLEYDGVAEDLPKIIAKEIGKSRKPWWKFW
jgi:hypothetical protein